MAPSVSPGCGWSGELLGWSLLLAPPSLLQATSYLPLVQSVSMAILSTLIAFSVAKKVAVLTAAYAYGLPRVYRVVLRATRVHVAQPSARAMIARSTSRTLRTLRLPAKAVAAVRARLVQGTGGTAAGAGADPSAAASAASATAPTMPLPRARTEGAAANKASAAVRSYACGLGWGRAWRGRTRAQERWALLGVTQQGVVRAWTPASASGSGEGCAGVCWASRTFWSLVY